MSAETRNNDQNQGGVTGSGGKKENGAGRDKPNASRRKFLKLGLAGADEDVIQGKCLKLVATREVI